MAVSLCIILKIWSDNTVLFCSSQVILALDFFLQECQPKMWRSVVIQKGNTLLIQEVQEEDGGNYTCELKFEGKLIRRTVELKVTGKNLFSMPIGKKTKLWNNNKKMVLTCQGNLSVNLFDRSKSKANPSSWAVPDSGTFLSRSKIPQKSTSTFCSVQNLEMLYIFKLSFNLWWSAFLV